MSFWRTFGFHTVSAVETILDRESFTLEELLDEEEILQEVKSQNKKLLDFITQPQTLLKLFEYITLDSNEDADPKRRFKYPFLACEILCSEIWTITESIYRDESLLEILFSFLDQPPPLNPLLASYTSRVGQSLLSRRTAETLAYIKKRQGIISKFINHLANGSIMELLLKIIGSEETPEGSGTIQWLCTTELVPSLLSKFDPSLDEDVHESAGQTLADIITISSHVPSSPLLAQFESDTFIDQLFTYILSGSNSVLLNGLSVVIELLRRYAREATEEGTSLTTLPTLLSASVGKLVQFDEFLKTPVANNMLTTVGQLNPLGFYRLKVVDFYLSLLRARYRSIDAQFIKQGSLKIILDLFFGYRWNNFLHSIVEQIILTILDGQNDDLKYELLVTAGLLDRIVDANKINIAEGAKPRKARLGYMGFLTTISLSIAAVASTNPKIEELIEHHTDWKAYYNTSLSEIRSIMTKPLGGHRPLGMPVGNFAFSEGGEEEEEQPDTNSIFDQYKLGFGNEFPDDDGNDEYNDEPFDNSGFARPDYGHDDKSYELYDEDQQNNHHHHHHHDHHLDVDEVNSDDSDSEHEDHDWVERKIADVGSSPSEESGFPHPSPSSDPSSSFSSDPSFLPNENHDNTLHNEEKPAPLIDQQQQQQLQQKPPAGDDFGDFVSAAQES
jgi:serine/threonine-protein phosphatase 6 regulatory subunit 3